MFALKLSWGFAKVFDTALYEVPCSSVKNYPRAPPKPP